MPEETLYYLGVKALIANEQGQYLLLHVRNKGGTYWDLPGGRANKGETVSIALLREVKEETGITQLTIQKHLGMALTSICIPITAELWGGLILSLYCCSATITAPLQLEDGVELAWCSAAEVLERLAQFPEELRQAIAAEIRH
jgi:8-oxo-dGTP pyrophosphatase MutT (NUDIX family)